MSAHKNQSKFQHTNFPLVNMIEKDTLKLATSLAKISFSVVQILIFIDLNFSDKMISIRKMVPNKGKMHHQHWLKLTSNIWNNPDI